MNRAIRWIRQKFNAVNIFKAPVADGEIPTNEVEFLEGLEEGVEVKCGQDVISAGESNLEKTPLECPQEEVSTTPDETNKEVYATCRPHDAPVDAGILTQNISSCVFEEENEKNPPEISCPASTLQEYASQKRIFTQERTKEGIASWPVYAGIPRRLKNASHHQELNANLKLAVPEEFSTNHLQLQLEPQCKKDASQSPKNTEEAFVLYGEDCPPWIRSALAPLKRDYIVEELFDSGTYGSIVRLTTKADKKKVAAKLVPSDKVGDQEIRIWSLLNHPNILPVLEIFEIKDAHTHIFISPLMEANIYNLVVQNNLDLATVQKYVKDAVVGLEYLHEINVAHLDIKPDNILVDGARNMAKICDFGFAAFDSSLIIINDVGMPEKFRPPEACLHLGWDAPVEQPKGCDLWGIGIVMLELFTDFPLSYVECPERGDWYLGIYPFLHMFLKKENFSDGVRSAFENVPEVSVDLLHDCIHRFLRKTSAKRMTCSEALRHPFFTGRGSFKKMPKDLLWKDYQSKGKQVLTFFPRMLNKRAARI